MNTTNNTAAANLPRNTMVTLPDGSAGRVEGLTRDGWIVVAQGRRMDEYQASQLKRA